MANFNIDRMKDLVGEWRGESDRACGIMGGALLDELLLRLLKHTMITEAPDDVFKFEGAAGTFSSRINLAYAMGVISTLEFQSLNIIRRIRNDFGHAVDQHYTFETPAIRSRVFSLSIVSTYRLQRVENIDMAPVPDTTILVMQQAETEARKCFEATVAILAVLLERRVKLIRKATIFPEIDFSLTTPSGPHQ